MVEELIKNVGHHGWPKNFKVTLSKIHQCLKTVPKKKFGRENK